MDEQKVYPLDIKISFHKIIEQYREKLRKESSSISREYLENMLEYVSEFPQLTEGIENVQELVQYKDVIKILLKELFPEILSSNEIKAISVPFHDFIFNSTEKFENVLQDAGEGYKLSKANSDEDQEYIYACIQILNSYCGYEIEYDRFLFYDIPDSNGIIRRYRAKVDWEFMDIHPKNKSREITEEDVDLLIQDIEDINLWKEMFPPQSWLFRGFTIISLIDDSVNEAISDLKTTLLERGSSREEELKKFESIFRSIFKVSDLRIGYTIHNQQSSTYMHTEGNSISGFLFSEEDENEAKRAIGEKAYVSLVKEHQVFAISNVKTYSKAHSKNTLSKNLMEEGAKSAIFAPIAKDQELFGILELTAYKKNQLNSVNAKKLDDILPYLVTAAERNIAEFENSVKAVIQSECTSIHPSVLWIFEEEARQFIKGMQEDGLASFRDITLKNVYPLYGQIDIVASSEARNEAIQKDLLFQLQFLLDILEQAYNLKPIAFYEHMKLRIYDFKTEVKGNLNASSEHKFFQLLHKEVNPLLEHLQKQAPSVRQKLEEYQELIDSRTGLIYNHRKNYDETVQQINRTLSRYIDRKQEEAQRTFPHYFERYRTDGIDHNIYIGSSLVNPKYGSFNKVFLYNLRLWQLTTMCEMENRFYTVQEGLSITLEAASLILVFNSTISIRYRMDEKKFDVDGAYNARYEVIKKRIDKACIKGTEERITQSGKLAIVYSQDSDKREYLRYIKYLQRKNYLGSKIELLELEDVQGVIGLKAIRVEILYNIDPQSNEEQLITYEDLMNELN